MADPQGSPYLNSVAGRPSMFPGTSISHTPTLNMQIPGVDPMAQAFGSMLLDPLMQGLVGPYGVPGQLNPTHNLWDLHRKKAQYQAMQSTMSSAAQNDQLQYVRMLQGTAALAGVSWNDERQRAAMAMASDMTVISPTLASIMPDTFDRLHGSRGSAVVMAGGIFRGGRYQQDPVTGQLGLSQQSVLEFNKSIYERLYGPGADLSEMRGLGAGRTGELYDEAARRGFMGRSVPREQTLREMASSRAAELGGGMGGFAKAAAELSSLDSPQMDARVRQFEAQKVGDRIKGMAGAIAAVRDLFGENGRPDAPMSMLFEALQTMTQGGMSRMDPTRIEGIVRSASNVARRTGMGIDNLMQLMANGAGRADAAGVDRVFGVTSSLQSAAFGQAYAGMANGPAWGRADRETLMLKDQQLRVNAAGSAVGNQLAALVRIGDERGFSAGSEAAEIYEAVKKGEMKTRSGKSVHIDPGLWSSVMQAGGIDAQSAAVYRSQTAYNQKTFDDAGLMDLTRSLQGQIDIAPHIRRSYSLMGRKAGLDDASSTKLADVMASGLLDDLDPNDFRNADVIADRMGVSKTNTAERAKIRQAVSTGWGDMEQAIKLNPRLRGYSSFDQAVMLHRKRTLDAGRSHTLENEMEGRLQSALAGIGTEGPMARIVDAISGATPGTSAAEVLAEALNVTPDSEIVKRLEPAVKGMQNDVTKFGDKGLDNQARIQMLNKLRTSGNRLSKNITDAGYHMGALASKEDADRVWQALRDKRGSGREDTEGLISKLLYDPKSMETLGSGGLDLLNRLRDRNIELAGLPAGDPQSDRVREAMMGDLMDVRGRLAKGKPMPLSAAEQDAINKEISRRTRPGDQVLGEAFRALGIGVLEKDRMALAGAHMVGPRGDAIRQASNALVELRGIKNGMSDADFQAYLKKGLDGSASADEKRLYHLVSGGKAGGGLAGLGASNLHRDAIGSALSELGPQSQVKPTTQSKMHLTGKLVLDMATNTARVDAFSEGVG